MHAIILASIRYHYHISNEVMGIATICAAVTLLIAFIRCACKDESTDSTGTNNPTEETDGTESSESKEGENE